MRRILMLQAGIVLALVISGVRADAQVTFWQRSLLSGAGDFGTATNWSTGVAPTTPDLAVIAGTSVANANITSNQNVDSLRISDGGDVVQSAGTLTIESTSNPGDTFPDNGLWVGEFGPIASTYTLNGGSVVVNDGGDGLMIGRAGGSVGVFNLNAGTVSNTVGDTHIGLDGTATWNQSAGRFNGAGVQIGRFASPAATVNLSGTASWDVGLVLLADGHGVFNPRNPGPVDFNVSGPNVSLLSNGLVMLDEGNLTFDGAGGGISTFDLRSGIFLLNNGELFLQNLPSPAANQVLVLLDNIGVYNGSDTQFDNAPDGTIYGGWELDYTATQVRLVSTVVPEPGTLILGAFGCVALWAAGRSKR